MRNYAREIANWDCEDIKVLRDLLLEYRTILIEQGHSLESSINIFDLPTEDIPEAACEANVIAMDKQGHCLVCDETYYIEHIDEIV